MSVTFSSDTSVDFQRTTGHYISEDIAFISTACDSLKSYKACYRSVKSQCKRCMEYHVKRCAVEEALLEYSLSCAYVKYCQKYVISYGSSFRYRKLHYLTHFALSYAMFSRGVMCMCSCFCTDWTSVIVDVYSCMTPDACVLPEGVYCWKATISKTYPSLYFCSSIS
jgi:hypothetical protein